MPAFDKIEWRRFDFSAIVATEGIAVIDERRRPACREWLSRREYAIDTMDCTEGLEFGVIHLDSILKWEQRFRYALTAQCNLDALESEFHIEIQEGQGRVLEIVRADLAWNEDPRFMQALLSILRDYSRCQLAIGRRFFCLLVVDVDAPLVGAVIDHAHVPCIYRDPSPYLREFVP